MDREPTEMELRVARAIAEDAGWDWESGTKPGGYGIDRKFYLSASRAAIRAMREPTEIMVVNAMNSNNGMGPRSGVAVEDWQSMIDAASPPERDGAK